MSNKQQTLVILTPGFAASENDSTCLPMQQHFVRTINKLFPQLQIIILCFQYPYQKKTYHWFGNTIISFNGRNKGGWQKLLLRRKIAEALKKIHSDKKIIGLLSFWYGECAVAGKKFGEKYGIRHYCWILGQDAKVVNKYPQRVPPKQEELIVLSHFLQGEFERAHGIRPSTVIPPGIDVEVSDVVRKDIDVLGAGSLIPLKQYDIFISIVAELKKLIPDIKVVLIGQGPERKKLQELVIKADLGSTISFAGELPYGEVLQLMQRTKVFLHPSSYEGFSGVCMEALSRGAHVISFCQPMKENIRQWHIVNTKDEMRDKTLSILQNSNTVYESIAAFSMEATVHKMMALFDCTPITAKT